ncbi:MAG: PQQ-binding-like beta-propeller repeat protein [Phycisphaerales bacterium]
MSTHNFLRCIVIVALLSATPQVTAQDAATDRQQRLDTAFETLLSDVDLIGYFTLDNAPADAPLREDRYHIRKVTRLREGVFQFDAVMYYGERERELSIALPVKWAGDTPMISLSKVAIPGVGTFSAHILFNDGKYAGTWSGDDHGGHMFGRIAAHEEKDNDPAAVIDDLPGPADATAHRSDWPSFRGNGARGIADGFPTATTWNAREDKGVLWHTPVEGLAHSSPVIAGDRLFITSAIGSKEAELVVGLYGSIAPVASEGEHDFVTICLDKNTGKELWRQTAISATPMIERHPKGSHAASSPATDGRYVVSFFGSEGLYCYTVEGELAWKHDLGRLDSGYYMVKDAQWGFASSPIIHENSVIVQCDVQDESFLAAFNITDGSELWRTPREEVPTWSTPTVHVTDDGAQIIVNGYKAIGGYDFETGKQLWSIEGGGDIPVPTPIVADGIMYITNAHGRLAPIYAINADAAQGTIALEADGSTLVWYEPRRGNYMQTPLVYQGVLYCCNDAGILSAFDAATGELIYRERLGGGQTGFTASGVAADGKLYFTSEVGEVYVVRPGREFEVISVNDNGELCMASPAVSEGVIYFRTRNGVLAIAPPGRDD